MGAVVSDNDGSAFITKAEFDSLKNNFQAQIDQYNTSIDSKIDGAIASYLAGIKVEKKSTLDSILNELSQSWVSSDVLDFPSTRIGSYKRYFINIGICKCQWNAANTLAQLQYLTGAANNAQWNTSNSTDYGIFYVGDKNDNGNYKVTNYLWAYPFAAVAGVQTSGAWVADNSTITIPNKTFTVVDSSSFGAGNDSWNLIMGKSTAHNVGVVVAHGVKDEYKDLKLDLLTGSQLSSATTYFVESKYISRPGIYDYGTVTADFCGYEIQNKGVSWTTSTNRNTKLRIYTHYYSNMSRLTIINDKLTKKMNEDIFYYQGCPIFKVGSQNGKIKLKLHIDNSGNKPTIFKIQNSKFDNVALSESDAKTTNYNWNDTIKVNANTDVELEFDVKKDEVYWIKARPIYTPSGSENQLTYPSKITTKEITLTEE